MSAPRRRFYTADQARDLLFDDEFALDMTQSDIEVDSDESDVTFNHILSNFVTIFRRFYGILFYIPVHVLHFQLRGTVTESEL